MSTIITIEKDDPNFRNQDKFEVEALMKKHGISILDTKEDDEYLYYKLDSNPEFLEELFIYTRLPWHFGENF